MCACVLRGRSSFFKQGLGTEQGLNLKLGDRGPGPVLVRIEGVGICCEMEIKARGLEYWDLSVAAPCHIHVIPGSTAYTRRVTTQRYNSSLSLPLLPAPSQFAPPWASQFVPRKMPSLVIETTSTLPLSLSHLTPKHPEEGNGHSSPPPS